LQFTTLRCVVEKNIACDSQTKLRRQQRIHISPAVAAHDARLARQPPEPCSLALLASTGFSRRSEAAVRFGELPTLRLSMERVKYRFSDQVLAL
jgi:hypothetical protein